MSGQATSTHHVFSSSLTLDACSQLNKLGSSSHYIFDFSQVTSVDWTGMQALNQFVHQQPKQVTFEFTKMTSVFIEKLNLSPELISEKIKFASFFVPYQDHQGKVHQHLLTIEDIYSPGDLSFCLPEKTVDGKTARAVINPHAYFQFLPESDLFRYNIFNHLLDPVLVINSQKQVIYCNQSGSGLIGISLPRILKKSPLCFDVIRFENKELFCSQTGHSGETEATLYQETQYQTAKGENGTIQISIVPDKDALPYRPRWALFLHIVSLEKVLTNKYKAEAELKKQTLGQLSQTKEELEEFSTLALTDEMTGLHNFRAFSNELKKELNRSKRYQLQMGLVILDVDKFKKFNDTYGHQQGDEVLRSVAKALKQAVRKTDFVARYGGEEFVMIFPQISYEGLFTIMEKCRTNLQSTQVPYLEKPGEFLSVTASFGGVLIDHGKIPGEFDIKEFVEQSDKNLYEAKEGGRNRSVVSHYQPEITKK